MTPTPDTVSHSMVVYLYLGVATVILLLLRYILACRGIYIGNTEAEKLQRPPLLPFVIPWVGHVPLKFFLSPLGFARTDSVFWKRQPVRLRVLFNDIYLVQGAPHQLTLMKHPSLSLFFLARIFVINVFRLPKAAAETYYKDNSGGYGKPYAGSLVSHHNRVDFLVRSSHRRLLLGPGHEPLFRRSVCNARDRLLSIGIREEWTYISDFLGIFKSHLTAAAVDSLAGPALMAQHPSFAEDLWSIDGNITQFLLKLPRFMNPAAHRARDRALHAVHAWHAWARDNFYPESVDKEGNDPFWGSAYFRERQQMFSSMDGFDSHAMASEDLSFFWIAHTNAIISSFWITLEAFCDAALLRHVKEEVRSCIQTEADGQLRLDTDALLRQPLLQAMFAENLRLRVHGFLIRYSERDDIRISNWTIPHNNICMSSVTPTSMNPEFWSKERGAEHPVDEFWPGRFLQRDAETNKLQFSLAGTEGYWLPFGSGPHTCPGALFTKRQNLVTLALMVTMYDCEVLVAKKDILMDTRTYPLGVISPSNRVPVKMRQAEGFNTICV